MFGNGSGYFLALDLAYPVTINQTLFEVVGTPGGAGSGVHGGWYLDDGTFDKPGALLADLGTIATTTTGLKGFSTEVSLPKGRSWCLMVPQGAPTPDPTLRFIVGPPVGLHTVNFMPDLTRWAHLVTGVTGALPNPASVTTSAALAIAMAVRFK